MSDNSNIKLQKPNEIQLTNFHVRESYKTARTNIVYSILKQGCKKIVFTSSMKGEGKTVTSANIACALAQQIDTKVLVIECDLRAPKVHTVFQLNPTPGLTNYLYNECAFQDIIKEATASNLDVICYGAIPPNPLELLSSDKMKELVESLEKKYDYIIFDTPPVGVVSDAIPMVKLSDGVVLVAKNNYTTYPDLSRTIDTIKRADGKILGAIINKIEMSYSQKSKYYKNYGYYDYCTPSKSKE